MTSLGTCGASLVRRGYVPLLAALALLAAACSTPIDIKPLAMIDGEPVDFASADPYDRAKHFLREGHYGLAVQEFRAALAERPGSVMALNGLAIAYDWLGRPDLAERHFHRALAVRPDSVETLNNLGYSALRRGQVERARTAFERARSLAPEDIVVLANLSLLRQSGERAGATADWQPAAVDSRSASTALVARVDLHTQMLLTNPDPQLRELALDHGVEPALFAVPPR